MMTDEQIEEWIIVLVCSSNILEMKYWDGDNWTLNVEDAIVYTSYGKAIVAEYALPEDKVTHRLQAGPKQYHLKLLEKENTNSTQVNGDI